jgi:hypothetical protein
MGPGATTLVAAIDELAAVKAEHRRILVQIAGDPGMTPETRRTLLEHLYDEEDEHVRHIAALAGAGGGSGGGGGAGRLTVGSLRPPREGGDA